MRTSPTELSTLPALCTSPTNAVKYSSVGGKFASLSRGTAWSLLYKHCSGLQYRPAVKTFRMLDRQTNRHPREARLCSGLTALLHHRFLGAARESRNEQASRGSFSNMYKLGDLLRKLTLGTTFTRGLTSLPGTTTLSGGLQGRSSVGSSGVTTAQRKLSIR